MLDVHVDILRNLGYTVISYTKAVFDQRKHCINKINTRGYFDLGALLQITVVGSGLLERERACVFNAVLLLVWPWPEDTHDMSMCITNQSHKGSYLRILQMVRSFKQTNICMRFMAMYGFVREDERGWGWLPTVKMPSVQSPAADCAI